MSLTSDVAVQGSLASAAALVLLGSVVPVVPTGAVVAAAVAYAGKDGWLAVALALVVSALAALAGDLVTFGLLRSGAGRLAQRWSAKHGGEGLDRVEDQLRVRGVLMLVVSRLVPAGRIPVLLAAGIAGLPWRRVVPAQAFGCGLWSLVYGLVGVVGGGLFSNPLADAAAAVALVVLVTAVQTLLTQRRSRAYARARTS